MSAPSPQVHIRPARLADVPAVHALLREYAARGNLLARTREDLTRHVREFLVAEAHGAPIATGALEVMGPDLAEIRSLAVAADQQRRGIGLLLARRLIEDAAALGARRVMALTYVPEFFARLGFAVVPVETLPEKVWRACVKCYKFNRCDEIALMLTLPAAEAQVPRGQT
jgi:amino-acid N-acetyltransferase